MATGLAMAVAIGLWVTAAGATARHLTLAPRVRAIRLVLLAVTPTMITVVLITLNFGWAATQSAAFLVPALVLTGGASVSARLQIGRAVRRGRRLQATARGETIVNPPTQRTHGRHRT